MRVKARAGWLIVAGLAAVAAPLTAAPVVQAVPFESGVASEPVMSGFVMEPAENGTPMAGTVRNVATGRCLQMDAQQPYVYTRPCNGSIQQSWYWRDTVPGWKELRSSYSIECLDASPTTGRVYVHTCNGGGYQRWNYFVTKQILQGASHQALDSNFEGSVYLSPRNDGNFQKWE